MVFLITVIAYAAIITGAILHPSENNLATWIIWMMLSSTFLYAQIKEGHAGWQMALGYLIGNVAMLFIAWFVGDYTFNLGPAESIALFGFIGAVVVWTIIGITTKKWDSRLLYFGSVLADLASFYPMWKQYITAHEAISTVGLIGWIGFFIGAFVNAVWVEHCVYKFMLSPSAYRETYGVKKRALRIVEESLLSLEVLFSVGSTLTLIVI